MMDRNQAADDLQEIRAIMKRTRVAMGRRGGWFMVIGGVMWLLGFLGNHFLEEYLRGYWWGLLNMIFTPLTIGLAIRMGRTGEVRTSIWKPITLFWMILMVYCVVMILVLNIQDEVGFGLFILLCVGLGYAQLGLFGDPKMVFVGVGIIILAVAAYFITPAHFYLAMAFLGGGLLIGSGLWYLRAGR